MSIAIAPLHTIRMSTQDWNELLVTAINAGYKNRTEYMRAILKGDKLWSSEQPPTEIEPELYLYKAKWQAATASLEVYTNDAARFLARAEAAETKTNELQAEIERLRALPINETSTVLVYELPPRPTVEGLYPGWTDKKKKRWDTDTYKHKQWCLDVAEEILDTIYGAS